MHLAPATSKYLHKTAKTYVDLVQNDSELFARAVSLFPLLGPEKSLEEQRAEFGPYVEYVKAPVTVPVPDGETKNSMSH